MRALKSEGRGRQRRAQDLGIVFLLYLRGTDSSPGLLTVNAREEACGWALRLSPELLLPLLPLCSDSTPLGGHRHIPSSPMSFPRSSSFFLTTGAGPNHWGWLSGRTRFRRTGPLQPHVQCSDLTGPSGPSVPGSALCQWRVGARRFSKDWKTRVADPFRRQENCDSERRD